jgi:cyanophycinase-like exopeptidase
VALNGEVRLLAIMGSGETTPTMVKVHRQLFERLGRGTVPAVLLDTPYGFQANAPDISARAVSYFRESVHRQVGIASLGRAEQSGRVAFEAALARISEARWVFAGPGSPTYALRQWRPTIVPKLLADKLLYGGCIVFASAAALTLGRWTVPVYEVYKVGADPVWAEGLDLLTPLGMTVAVIPHFDNAEGGTHDTRYCYLGEERLRVMEAQLPPDGWVLGVDEHTACIFDFDAGTATVLGLGSVTIRRHGRSGTVPAGKTLAIDELVQLEPAVAGSNPGEARPLAAITSTGPARDGSAAPVAGARSPLLEEVRRLSTAFDAALAARDAEAATAAILELEETLHSWSADTFQSDEVDQARGALRRMVVRLGELAAPGLRDPRDVLAPWVEPLLAERAEARRSHRFADGDRIRERLDALGVEVRDTPTGTDWYLRADGAQGAGVGPGPCEQTGSA